MKIKLLELYDAHKALRTGDLKPHLSLDPIQVDDLEVTVKSNYIEVRAAKGGTERVLWYGGAWLAWG